MDGLKESLVKFAVDSVLLIQPQDLGGEACFHFQIKTPNKEEKAKPLCRNQCKWIKNVFFNLTLLCFGAMLSATVMPVLINSPD